MNNRASTQQAFDGLSKASIRPQLPCWDDSWLKIVSPIDLVKFASSSHMLEITSVVCCPKGNEDLATWLICWNPPLPSKPLSRYRSAAGRTA
jgi:hypothetical protein